jgi:MFS family permease
MTSPKNLDPAEPFSVVARGLIPSLYLPTFLMSVCQGTALLMIPLFALDLGANAGIAALVFSLRGLGNATSDIPAGSVASRLGDKVAMMIGICLMTVTSIAAGFAESPLHLGLSAFLFGVAMSTWLIGRLTHVAETIPSHHRGKTIALMAGLQRLGTFVGPVVGGILAMKFGFGVVFWILGGVSTIALLLVLFTVNNHKSDTATGEISVLKAVPTIIRQHAGVFVTAGSAMLSLTMIRASRQLIIPLWGVHIGLNTSEIGLVMGAAAAVDMCMFPVAGYVMDTFGRKPVALSCLTFLVIGLCIVPFTTEAIPLALASMVVGFGNGLGSGINMTLGADFSPAENRGEFMGVWRLISDSGAFGGPILIGLAAQSIALSAAFAVAATTGVIGIIITLFFVQETLVRINDRN